MFFALQIAVYCSGFICAQDDGNREQLRQAQKSYDSRIRPMIESACSECHWGEDADAGLDFGVYEDLRDILDSRSEWEEVINRVSKKQMPPQGSPPLSETDREQLTQWLDQLLNNLDCSDTRPGAVTIRRLNRTEYRNTIRDLTGIDFRPASDFPGDDVGYGFDNIGDVLSLPPILMEKYLDAAESILDEAIVDPQAVALDVEYEGADFPAVRGSRHRHSGAHSLSTNGTLAKRVNFPVAGTYKVNITAFGTHAGDDWPQLQASLDSTQAQGSKVKSVEANPSQHQAVFEIDEAASHRIEFAFTNDFYDPDNPDRSKRDRNLIIESVRIVGPTDREFEMPMSHRMIVGDAFFESTEATEPAESRNAARSTIANFAARAFRRPVREEEVTKLLEFYTAARRDGDNHEMAIRYALQPVLVSPHFLFKVESPAPNDGKPHPLSQHELATSLSYFLWSSMPDAELTRLADAARLDQEAVQQQVTRMLANERAGALVENFAGQWLGLRLLDSVQPDPELFDNIDERLIADMATETAMLFADLVERDASVLELIGCRHTFVNERLARHYGFLGVTGEHFRKVALDETPRRGVLTHASILTLTSNPNRTSPVKRGKWIMENLLGEEPPPAAPDAAPLDEQTQLTGTLRQRMEQHRADPGCASCHQRMDQFGFSLEHFDAVGRWRDDDGGLPIDAGARLPDGLSFNGASGLQEALQSELRDQFVVCFTEKLLTYALGRGLDYRDQCAVNEIVKRARENDFRFSAFIVAVAESEPFRMRSATTTHRESP